MRPVDTGPPLIRTLYAGFVALLAALLVGALVPAAHATTAPHHAPAHPTTKIKPSWPGNAPNTTGGKDYFVDATLGRDSAAGTSAATAWRSLAKVSATTFAPGDRVLLKAGEQWQDEQLWPKGSGSAGRPITISAYGDSGAGRPYIATNGEVPSPFKADGSKNPATVGLTGAIVLRNQQYWDINNVELSNDNDFATDITTGSYVRDGIMVSINADLLKDGADSIMDHFRISDVFVHDLDGPSSWQRIHYGAVDFQVFGSRSYKDYGTGGYYFKDVRIENNTFENVELHAVQFAFNWFAADGADAGQYDESGKWHEGWEQLWVRTRDLYSRDVYIGHNYAESIGQGAIQLADTKNMKVEYNEVNGYLKRYDAVSCALYLWAGADSVMQSTRCTAVRTTSTTAPPGTSNTRTSTSPTSSTTRTTTRRAGWPIWATVPTPSPATT